MEQKITPIRHYLSWYILAIKNKILRKVLKNIFKKYPYNIAVCVFAKLA